MFKILFSLATANLMPTPIQKNKNNFVVVVVNQQMLTTQNAPKEIENGKLFKNICFLTYKRSLTRLGFLQYN